MNKKSTLRVEALRETIRRSFPAIRYDGKITHYDEDLDHPELDEDKDLYEALKGKSWTEVPGKLLLHLPSGYSLLTDEAFITFLPAWLMYSLDDMEHENEVRNFLVYALSYTARQFHALSPEQRLTVRSLLAEFAERGTVPFVRKLVPQALENLDNIM